MENKENLLIELSEDGAKEVTEITVKDGDKSFRAIIVMDYSLYQKAFGLLMNPTVQQGADQQSNVSIDMDLAGAGDKILFLGWHSGDDEIRKKLKLRVKAGQLLGQWLMQLNAGVEDDGEKKS